jgi:SH2 domain
MTSVSCALILMQDFHTLSFAVDLFLKNFVAANPAKSMYGFTLNRKKPGHFCLCFLANKNSTVQTWVGVMLVTFHFLGY